MAEMSARKEFDEVEKLLQKNSDLLGTIRAELSSVQGAQAATYKTQIAKYKDECEEAKKKFKKMKKDKMNSDYLFSEDPEDKTISEPLLGGDPHKKDQEKKITSDLENMAYAGREADIIAGDTAAELARNRQVMMGTSARTSSSRLIVEIEKQQRKSDLMVKAAIFGVIGVFVLVILIRVTKFLYWLFKN